MNESSIGTPADPEATANGSLIALIKRLRSLMGGTGSVRITDGAQEAAVHDTALALYTMLRNASGNEAGTTTDPLVIREVGTSKTLKRAVVSLTASGNVVAAVAGKVLKVYEYEIQSLTDSMTVLLEDGSAGADLAGAYSFNAREGIAPGAVTPPNYLFKTTAATALYATLTGTGTVKIAASYWDDDAS